MTNNIPVYTLEDPSAILQRMVNYFQTAQTQITDFNQGSEILNILSSINLTNYELRVLVDYILQMGYVQTAAGDWLDALGVPFGILRKSAIQSTGPLVISTSAAFTDDIDIPDGTLLTCSTDPTLYFQTVGDQTLTAGSLTLNLTGIATVGGADGNVAPGIIDTFYVPIAGLTITNPTAFSNGMDPEDDTSLRSRILAAGQGNITGSISWYAAQGGAVEGVHDVGVINNPPIPGYDIELLVNGNVQPTPTEVVEAVQALFNQPDCEIGGVNVLVTSPTFIIQNINVAVALMPGYDWDTVSATLESDIQCYFMGGTTSYGTDFPGLNVGNGFSYMMLQMVIANSLASALLTFNASSPSTDVTIADDQAVQLGTITLTQAN
jgi:uncharacterized phage protein gp47/JayE